MTREIVLFVDGYNKRMDVELSIDFEALARILGSRAYGLKGVSTVFGGVIKAKVKT